MGFSVSLESHFVEKIIIVGGGIAGLTCLNALIDAGVNPLLIEAGTIGSPKMCGEFIAPSAVTQLEKWNVGAIENIKRAKFFSKNHTFHVDFKLPAGAIARSEAEVLLAKRAIKNNGRIWQNVSIQTILPPQKNDSFLFTVDTGEVLRAENVFFATGRFGQKKLMNQPLPYVGLKTHINKILEPHTLLMHSIEDAYFGLIPISTSISNFACLIKKEALKIQKTGKDFFLKQINQNAFLKELFREQDLEHINMLETPSPEFFLRNNPLWPNAYWIGDSLASFPPAIGYGFAHGINSALFATECFLELNSSAYAKKLRKQVKPKLFIGKLMHYCLLNPHMNSWLFPFLRMNPWISKLCLKKIGYY